jgi:hypothetical protein
MIGRLMAITLVAIACLVCVPDTDAHDRGFNGVRFSFNRGFNNGFNRGFNGYSRPVIVNNFGGYGGGGAFIPRSNVVFVPSGGIYGGYGGGFQSQVLFAPTTGGCYGGGGGGFTGGAFIRY